MRKKIVIIIQYLIIYPSLLLLYIFGFGITALLAHIFNPSLVREKKTGENTFWQKPDAKCNLMEKT